MAELDEHVPTALEQLVLSAGIEDGPTAAEMGRAAQALGIPHALVPLAAATKLGADGGSAIVAKGTGKVAAWVKWTTLGLGAVGVAVVGGSFVVGGPEAPASASDVTERAPRAVEPTVVKAPVREESVKATPAAATPAPPDPRRATGDKRATAARPAQAPVPAAAPESRLGEEIALLDVARQALGRGSSADALSALAEYGRKHPNGMMRQEATLLRLEALQKAGRQAEARALAERLIRRNPSSPHRKRIESLVGRL